MIRRRFLVPLFAALVAGCSSGPSSSPASASSAPSAAPAPPLPPITGQWRPVSSILGGKLYPVANFNGATLRLTTTAYEFAGDKGTYTVVSTRPPAKMDIRVQEGPNAGRTIPVIFAIENGQLVVCFQLGSGDRPAAFGSPQGSNLLLVRFQRAA